MTTVDTYDLICSLGGNCAIAYNLRYRNMRYFSLPFDWTYIKDEKPIEFLTYCFKGEKNFKDIALKSNLELVEVDKKNDGHRDKIKYRDNLSKFYFFNHFTEPIEMGGVYDNFKKTFDKRIDRMLELIEKSSKILFILSTSFDFELSYFYNLFYT